jgi:hypothetical protein
MTNPTTEQLIAACQWILDRGNYIAPECNQVALALRSRLNDELRVAVDSGKLWSFLRNVVEHGAAIRQDYDTGNLKTYEEYAAHIDDAARVRTEQLETILAGAQQPSPRVADETAWLLERQLENQPLQYAFVHPMGFGWTTDSNVAFRMARRRDADALAAIMEDATRVAEHVWSAAASPHEVKNVHG